MLSYYVTVMALCGLMDNIREKALKHRISLQFLLCPTYWTRQCRHIIRISFEMGLSSHFVHNDILLFEREIIFQSLKSPRTISCFRASALLEL